MLSTLLSHAAQVFFQLATEFLWTFKQIYMIEHVYDAYYKYKILCTNFTKVKTIVFFLFLISLRNVSSFYSFLKGNLVLC